MPIIFERPRRHGKTHFLKQVVREYTSREKHVVVYNCFFTSLENIVIDENTDVVCFDNVDAWQYDDCVIRELLRNLSECVVFVTGEVVGNVWKEIK